MKSLSGLLWYHLEAPCRGLYFNVESHLELPLRVTIRKQLKGKLLSQLEWRLGELIQTQLEVQYEH